MKFAFFTQKKPRKFNYKPIYYDPAKEEAEERKKLRESGQGDDHRERMRAEIKRRWRTEKTEVDKRDTVFRIFFYIIIAVFSIYLIFFTDFVNKLVSFFL
jgi:hypothetical protein